MSAFSELPWMPSSEQFLRAMIAGGERGVQLERLRQSDQPRGGGGGGVTFGGQSALESARTAAIVGEEKRKADMSASAQKAWELRNSLISRGATPQEAYNEAGLAQFGLDQPQTVSDVTPMSLGRGGVGLFNKGTGAVSIVREPSPYPEKAAPEARISSVDTTGMTPDQIAMSRLFNAPRVSGTAGTVNAYLNGTNKPAANEIVRTTKDGRKVVFDSQTKQFIRYAD